MLSVQRKFVYAMGVSFTKDCKYESSNFLTDTNMFHHYMMKYGVEFQNKIINYKLFSKIKVFKLKKKTLMYVNILQKVRELCDLEHVTDKSTQSHKTKKVATPKLLYTLYGNVQIIGKIMHFKITVFNPYYGTVSIT